MSDFSDLEVSRRPWSLETEVWAQSVIDRVVNRYMEIDLRHAPLFGDPHPPVNHLPMFRESFREVVAESYVEWDFIEGTERFERLTEGRLELGLIGADPRLAWPDLGWGRERSVLTGCCRCVTMLVYE